MTPGLAAEVACVALTATAAYLWGRARCRAAYPAPPDVVVDITPRVTEFQTAVVRALLGVTGVQAAEALRQFTAAMAGIGRVMNASAPRLRRMADALREFIDARDGIQRRWSQSPFERDMTRAHESDEAYRDTLNDRLVVTR